MGAIRIENGVLVSPTASNSLIPIPPLSSSVGHALKSIENHLHPVGGTKLYPEGVTPITLSSGATSDLFGGWVEIVPVNTITEIYDPTFIYFANVSDVARYYVIEVACGLSGSEEIISRIVAGATSSSKGVKQFNSRASKVEANDRLSMRVKDDENAVNTIDVAIGYHEYPDIPI